MVPMQRRTFLQGAVVVGASTALGWKRPKRKWWLVAFDTVLMMQSAKPSKDVPGILDHPGVNAMSQSIQWKAVERTKGSYDFSAFDIGVKMAHEHGVAFQPRIRGGGGGTPDFHKGRTMRATSGLSGATFDAPVPVMEDGKPNWTWLNGFKNLCNAYDAWCNANMNANDGPIHRTWFGGASAEIFISQQMLNLPGVTQEAVENAYLRNLEIAASKKANLASELSISGLEAGPALKSLQAKLHLRMGVLDLQKAFWTQRNGFSDSPTTDGSWGGPTPPPHGLQMIKAFRQDGSAFNWAKVYNKAAKSFSVMGQRGWIEVYEQSFTGPGAAGLYAEAAKWAA